MQSMPSYTRALEENYAVRFVYVGILDIVEGMMSSHLLSAKSNATYIS